MKINIEDINGRIKLLKNKNTWEIYRLDKVVETRMYAASLCLDFDKVLELKKLIRPVLICKREVQSLLKSGVEYEEALILGQKAGGEHASQYWGGEFL